MANDTLVDKLLHCDANVVSSNGEYSGQEVRPAHNDRDVLWEIVVWLSTYEKLGKRSVLYKAKLKIEKTKAQVCADFVPLSGMIEGKLGSTKVKFRCLAKNDAK